MRCPFLLVQSCNLLPKIFIRCWLCSAVVLRWPWTKARWGEETRGRWMNALNADDGEVQGDGADQGKHRDNEFEECCRMGNRQRGWPRWAGDIISCQLGGWKPGLDGWANQLSQLCGGLCLDCSAWPEPRVWPWKGVWLTPAESFRGDFVDGEE